MPEHKVTVGNVEILSLSDGRLEFHVADFFPSVPTEAWAPYRDQLTPEGRIVMNVGSFLLRSEGQTVLVDTGLGDSARGFRDVVYGLLLRAMKAKGVQLEDVDLVMITHLHRDHVGWNLLWNGDACRPTFPKAAYWVPRADWEFYTRGPRVFSYVKEQVAPLDTLGLLNLMEGERAMTGQITALPTPGHTPGHTSVLVLSQGEGAVILGDAAHVPAQVQETDWSPRADADPLRSSVTRRTLMERIEREGLLAISGHFPAPGFGRVLRLRGRRHWKAL